jgi:hypothetical protein
MPPHSFLSPAAQALVLAISSHPLPTLATFLASRRDELLRTDITSLLMALELSGHWEWAPALLRWASKEGVTDASALEMVVRALGHEGQHDAVCALLDEMPLPPGRPRLHVDCASDSQSTESEAPTADDFADAIVRGLRSDDRLLFEPHGPSSSILERKPPAAPAQWPRAALSSSSFVDGVAVAFDSADQSDGDGVRRRGERMGEGDDPPPQDSQHVRSTPLSNLSVICKKRDSFLSSC